MPLEWLKQAGQEWTDQGQNAPVSEDQSSPPTPTPAGNSDSSDGGIRSVFKDWTAQENESQVEVPAVQPTKLPDQVVLKPVRTGDAKTLPLPDPNKPDTQQDSDGDPVISSPIHLLTEEHIKPNIEVTFPNKELKEEDVVTPSGKVRLIMDEGERLSPYKDSQKIRTIGVGFNLEDPDNAELFKEVTGHDPAKADITITKTQSRQLLEKTVSRAENDAKDVFPNFDQLPSTVKDALTNFTFNLGQTKASEFKKTIAAVKAGDGVKAAQQLRQSLWYKQVGARAERIAKIIESDLKPESTDEVYRDEHGNDFTLNSDGTLVPHK